MTCGRTNPAWPISARIAAARQLRRARFDACLVFSPGLEAYLLASMTGAPVRVGLVYSRRVLDRLMSPVLLTASSIARVDEAVATGRPVPHLVEQTMAVVVRAGLPAGKGDLEVVKEAGATRRASALLARLWPSSGLVVGLHLSPKWFESGWVAADVKTLVEKLLAALPGSAALLTCGIHDRSAMEAVAAEWGTAPDAAASTWTMCGGRAVIAGVDYPRWVALLACCDVVVTRDTASVHLASALGRPEVVVYAVDGFARNSQQFAPWRVPHRIVADGAFDRVATEVVEAVGALAMS